MKILPFFLHILGSCQIPTVKHWLRELIFHFPAPLHRCLFSSFFILPSFSTLSSTHKTGTHFTNIPLFLFLFCLSFSSSFLSAPLKDFCLLTSWSKASAGLRLAPIIRAWQGATVLTCQSNKHPLWHPSVCVLRGVSQPPSSGPLISWIAHSAYTSTRLLCSGQAAIVLPCRAILMTLILLEAFRLVSDMVIKRKAER